ncbi:hypothetical protein ACJW30_12G175300 [Castanea mollissima]
MKLMILVLWLQFGCLHAISTILESVSRLPQLFLQVEPTLVPIMRRMLTSDGQGPCVCFRKGSSGSKIGFGVSFVSSLDIYQRFIFIICREMIFL